MLRHVKLISLIVTSISLWSCSKNSPTSDVSTGLTINTVTPLHGPDSTSVTISGTGFSTSPTADEVFFNGKQATVTSASETQLVVMVPSLAGTGNISVKVNGLAGNGPVFSYDTTYLETFFAGNMVGVQNMASDANGNLYVTTIFGNTVFKISPTGITDSFATIPEPQGISVDVAGNIYISSYDISSSTNLFYKIVPGGNPTVYATFTIANGEAGSLSHDLAGNLYAALANGDILKVADSGTVSVFKTGIPGLFGLVVGMDGNIYVTSTPNASIATDGIVFKITPAGITNTFASGFDFSGGNGISTDAKGGLYIVNSGLYEPPLQSVGRINTDGISSTLATGFTTFPIIAIPDNAGNIYVLNKETSTAVYQYGKVSKLTPM